MIPSEQTVFRAEERVSILPSDIFYPVPKRDVNHFFQPKPYYDEGGVLFMQSTVGVHLWRSRVRPHYLLEPMYFYNFGDLDHG